MHPMEGRVHLLRHPRSIIQDIPSRYCPIRIATSIVPFLIGIRCQMAAAHRIIPRIYLLFLLQQRYMPSGR